MMKVASFALIAAYLDDISEKLRDRKPNVATTMATCRALPLNQWQKVHNDSWAVKGGHAVALVDCPEVFEGVDLKVIAKDKEFGVSPKDN